LGTDIAKQFGSAAAGKMVRENGAKRVKNGQGNGVRVDFLAGRTVTYRYDTNNNFIVFTDPPQNNTVFAYDGGRRKWGQSGFPAVPR
jgi:YD repeat-containing protein